jgi:hypothetical protein
MKKILVIGLLVVLALSLSASVYGRYIIRVQYSVARSLSQPSLSPYDPYDPTVSETPPPPETPPPSETPPPHPDYGEPNLEKSDDTYVESGYTGGGGGPSAACW